MRAAHQVGAAWAAHGRVVDDVLGVVLEARLVLDDEELGHLLLAVRHAEPLQPRRDAEVLAAVADQPQLLATAVLGVLVDELLLFLSEVVLNGATISQVTLIAKLNKFTSKSAFASDREFQNLSTMLLGCSLVIRGSTSSPPSLPASLPAPSTWTGLLAAVELLLIAV